MSFPRRWGIYVPNHVRVAVESGDCLGAIRIAEFLRLKESERVTIGLPSRRTARDFTPRAKTAHASTTSTPLSMRTRAEPE
jgi:hypothetical protein